MLRGAPSTAPSVRHGWEVAVGRAEGRGGGVGASPLSLVVPAPGAGGQDPLLLGALGGDEGGTYARLLGEVWLSGTSTRCCALDGAGEQPRSLGENGQYLETAGALAIIQLSPELEVEKHPQTSS